MTADHDVGYKKPPQHSQFKKGQSGNAKGRPRGTRNFQSDLRDELAEPVNVREDGSVSRGSSQRAALKKLRAKALNGNLRALEKLLALAERHGIDDAADEAEHALSQSDQQIVDRHNLRVIQEYEANRASADKVDDDGCKELGP